MRYVLASSDATVNKALTQTELTCISPVKDESWTRFTYSAIDRDRDGRVLSPARVIYFRVSLAGADTGVGLGRATVALVSGDQGFSLSMDVRCVGVID